MMMPSGKWCASIALLCLVTAEQASAGDPIAAASESANVVLGQFGTSEGLRQRATVPLTAGGVLQSIDGSDTGSVHLTRPSSTAFMTLLLQPGTTGDLALVRVSQDLNFSGNADYIYQVPVLVSGVCANGIVSCNAGTWENCNPYRWTADADGRVSLEGVGLGSLGGCYCINQSCGNNLAWDNLAMLLKDLGGGAVGAVQQKKDGYVITQVRIDGPSIVYYGQNNSGSTSGRMPQTGYLHNQAALGSDLSGEVIAQAADPESHYSMMTASFMTRGATNDLKRCSITRNVSLQELSLSDIIMPVGGTGAVQLCGTDCIRLILGRQGDNYWSGYCSIFEENYTVHVNRPDMINKATLVRAIWDDYIQVWIGGTKVYNGPNADFPPETSGACELSTSWNLGLNKDVTPHFQQQGQVDTKIRVSVSGGGEGYAFVEVRTNSLCETLPDVITDHCQALAANRECQLQEESVDGVLTWHHFNPTGITPLPSTRTISASASCARDITRNWWRKERQYLCKTSNSFDFTEVGQRVHTITGSTLDNPASSTIPYDDLRKDHKRGAWLFESNTLRLPDLPGVEDCQFVCKTRKPAADTRISPSGTTATFRSSTESWEFFYKTCIDNTGCPLEPGEEIVKTCQCLNEFAEAASIMSVLDGAARDMICSDGTPK